MNEHVPLLPRMPEPVRPPESDVLLVLRPLRDSVPAAQRLKRLVKAAGRAYRFRVLRCADVGDEPGPLQRIARGERHEPAAGAGVPRAFGAPPGAP